MREETVVTKTTNPAGVPSRAASRRIFTLEAMNAEHGDALLLHCGTTAKPRHLLLDGGPAGVYQKVVKPRLQAIAAARGVEPLPLEHVFVTHIDDDHIRGILDFLADMERGLAPAQCDSFWFNAFNSIKQEIPPELADVSSIARLPGDRQSSHAVLASVAQGEELRDMAKRRAARVNGGSAKSLMADGAGMKLKLAPDLDVTLVSPNRGRLLKLYEEWKQKARHTPAETAAYVDRSVYNLASLVLVVKAKIGRATRSMLLTGDARGDDVLEGLAAGGFLADGRCHFDILKVAHHGSDRNYEADFFNQVTADHYVISANGRDENPSVDTLVWIAAARGDDKYMVHLTNRSNSRYRDLQANIAAALEQAPSLAGRLSFRDPDALSLSIHLGGKTAF